MCEYCGCQDVPAIAALIAEHDELRAVARDVVAAAGSGDRRETAPHARRLLDLLRPHTEIEEQALFPVMAVEFADHIESLTDDHRRIEEMLARVADPDAENQRWKHDLDTALGDLFTHILREQDGLFPAALSVLSPDDWDHLDQVREKVQAGPLPTS